MRPARERARAKHESVRIILKMYCTKRLLGFPDPTDDMYADMMERALEWWDALVADAAKDGEWTERELAEATIEKIRQSPESAWARILRADGN